MRRLRQLGGEVATSRPLNSWGAGEPAVPIRSSGTVFRAGSARGSRLNFLKISVRIIEGLEWHRRRTITRNIGQAVGVYSKMTRGALSLTLAALALPAAGLGQPSAEPIRTTLCDLVKHPTRYAGKLVRVRATIASAFEMSSLATDPPDDACWYRVWLAGPGDDHSITATPEAIEYADVRSTKELHQQNQLRWHPIPKLELLKDDSYGEFERCLSEVYRPTDPRILCMACNLYSVTATITGRFDYSKGLLRAVRDRAKNVLDVGSFGFGHLSKWDSQLTLVSVSEVAAKQIYGSAHENRK